MDERKIRYLFTDKEKPNLRNGLPDAFDALQCASGYNLHKIDPRPNKIVATVDARPIIHLFARRVAYGVIHLWDAPLVVREYLETGEKSKRLAAWESAREAITGESAKCAVLVAVQACAQNIEASRAIAEYAQRSDKQEFYRRMFHEMVRAGFSLQTETERTILACELPVIASVGKTTA